MSKIDQVKEMNTAPDLPPGIRLMDLEMLQAKMETVKQELQDWGGRNADVLKAYRELQVGVRSAAASVKEAINSAQDVPAETARLLEASAKKCEESAQRAQAVYDSARHIVAKSEQLAFWKIILTACLTSMGTAALLMLIL